MNKRKINKFKEHLNENKTYIGFLLFEDGTSEEVSFDLINVENKVFKKMKYLEKEKNCKSIGIDFKEVFINGKE